MHRDGSFSFGINVLDCFETAVCEHILVVLVQHKDLHVPPKVLLFFFIILYLIQGLSYVMNVSHGRGCMVEFDHRTVIDKPLFLGLWVLLRLKVIFHLLGDFISVHILHNIIIFFFEQRCDALKICISFINLIIIINPLSHNSVRVVICRQDHVQIVFAVLKLNSSRWIVGATADLNW